MPLPLWQSYNPFIFLSNQKDDRTSIFKQKACTRPFLFSLFQKESQWVVCDGEDIVWLVNERCDNRYRVTDKTRNVLLLRVTKEDGQ